MIYYITKTNANVESLDLRAVEILPLIELKTIFSNGFEELFLKCDSLIFTSKNAVFALEENISHSKNKNLLREHWLNIPNYVLGPKIAAILEDLGYKVEFIASVAYGDDFAREVAPLLKGKNPLFVRAKKIASCMPDILKESGIKLESLVVYENCLIKLEAPPCLELDSIIFFSAPSHIRAFLLNFTWNHNFIALCIGDTTRKAAANLLRDAKILQSPKVNVASALEFARGLKGS